MRLALSQLSPETFRRGSRAIADRLQAWPTFRDATTLMVYLAIEGGGEIDLADVIDSARRAGKRVLAPRIDWSTGSMIPVSYDPEGAGLEIRRHGVPEPVSGAPVPLEDLDLIFVPGLSFDRHGARLGRGAGYYDRFLEAVRATPRRAFACGVCLEAQVVDEIPHEAHDQHVDALVTERGLMMF